MRFDEEVLTIGTREEDDDAEHATGTTTRARRRCGWWRNSRWGCRYAGLVTGAVGLDLGIGRRTRPLGPLVVRVAAPREVLFDVIAAPYALRSTRAMREKVQVLERGADLVLAAHRTPIRGTVPHVVESFTLDEHDDGTVLTYTGELGTDLWSIGSWWEGLVAARWEATVEAALATAWTP